MKKALIIANMMLASASVFGMNIKLDREPAKRSFLHAESRVFYQHACAIPLLLLIN